MSHVVPILCLIFFILFLEVQLKNDFLDIEKEFRDLEKRIKENQDNIKNNSSKINEIKNGKHLQ